MFVFILRLLFDSNCFVVMSSVLLLLLIFIYKDWAFWPVLIPGLVELIPRHSFNAGISPFFLLDAK